MVPTSEFGGQELSTDAQVTKFCEGKGLPSDAPGCYLLSKSLVKGANCHPIFGLGKAAFPGEIQWNFDCIFVFNKEGSPVMRASISRPPTAEQLSSLM